MTDIQNITTLILVTGGTATSVRYAVNAVTAMLETIERICQKTADAWKALKRSWTDK